MDAAIPENTSRPGVDCVVGTADLSLRASRPKCHELENRALSRLASRFAAEPLSILEELAHVVLETLRAGSAGVSVLSDGGDRLRCAASAGALGSRAGASSPRSESLCGFALEAGDVQLFCRPERRYPHLADLDVQIFEGLIVPFDLGGAAVGTVWAVAHDDERRFDSEDARLISSLRQFASAGHRLLLSIEAASPEEGADVTRARLAAIVESSDDAIISKTLEGVITSWNQSAEKMFGYVAEEAIGRHISLIIPKERLHEEEDVLARLRRGDTIDHFETERETKDGRRLPISLTVSPVRDATGKIVGASKVARNIADRKRSEKERELLLTLAQNARREAEAANRTKDEFLAMLSHELRSPLNAMLGWLRILKSAGTRDAALVERAVDTLERNIWAQAQVINDLLDVSRILAGKLELDEKRVDLTALVKGCVESLMPSAEGKDLSLTLEAVEEIEIIGDPPRLQQIVSNLIGNAVKFTETGGVIEVRVDLPRGPASARILVRDTGIGIAPEVLPHIFERFWQADGGSSMRKHGGLGLGLSIVRHLVLLHGGAIDVESGGLGRGASFSVTLPLAGTRDRQPLASKLDEHPERTALDVLIVEDHDDTRAALELALLDHGARVRAVASVRQALEEYGVRPPDVLISDIGMPGEDGYVLIRAIRDLEEASGRRTLAIAMTGFAGRQDYVMALRAGFDAHVAKPVELEILLERVRVLAAARGGIRR